MSSNNTIFDDVFRTMVEKMPRLVIPLINEVFHTDYPPDVKLEQLRNEHQEENGDRALYRPDKTDNKDFRLYFPKG